MTIVVLSIECIHNLYQIVEFGFFDCSKILKINVGDTIFFKLNESESAKYKLPSTANVALKAEVIKIQNISAATDQTVIWFGDLEKKNNNINIRLDKMRYYLKFKIWLTRDMIKQIIENSGKRMNQRGILYLD